jgi:hypothetical protein
MTSQAMSDYIVEIQASNSDGTIWQALAPAETVTTDDASAEEVAREVAGNQNIAEGGNWRVCVWDGADADTGTEPAYALDATDA